MTGNQAAFVIGVLVILLIVFLWMTVALRRTGTDTPEEHAAVAADAEEIRKRLAGMEDISSRSVYRKVYHLEENETGGKAGTERD